MLFKPPWEASDLQRSDFQRSDFQVSDSGASCRGNDEEMKSAVVQRRKHGRLRQYHTLRSILDDQR
jgi:hypothetical protein